MLFVHIGDTEGEGERERLEMVESNTMKKKEEEKDSNPGNSYQNQVFGKEKA